jgi:hypothetical protein
MRNNVSGEIKELSQQEFLALFDQSVHEVIIANSKKEGVEAVVCFEILDLGLLHRHGPLRTALIVGPSCTFKVADLEHMRLGDVPSRFKYPVSMWRV